MELFLLRHGIAEDGKPGRPDSDRELTDEGRKKVAAVAKMARCTGVEPTLILTSPYVRAVQTAGIAAQCLGCTCPTLRTKALIPFGTPKGVWDELRDHGDEPAVLLSGHEPLLSELIPYLLGTPGLHIEMKKAMMVRIDLEVRATGNKATPPPGTLRWILTAKMAGCAG